MTTPYAHNPAPQLPAGTGLLRFTMPGNALTNSFVAPTVLLNGHRLNVSSGHGSFDFPVPAGTHHLHAHGQWMKSYGNADIDFTVTPGQLVEVFYASPVHQFADKGNIGFTPQKRPGIASLFVIVAIVIVLVVMLALL